MRHQRRPTGRRFAEVGWVTAYVFAMVRRWRYRASFERTAAISAPWPGIRHGRSSPPLPTIVSYVFGDLDKGVRIEELNGPLTPPTMLSISPGGTRVATATRGGTVHVWEPRSLAPPAQE